MLAPAHAGTVNTLWQTGEGQHVIVDGSDTIASSSLRNTRPLRTSLATLTADGQLGNVRIAMPVHAGCGYSDAQHLVVCLDMAYGISDQDRLRILSFIVDPYRVTAGSARTARSFDQAIAGAPVLAANGQGTTADAGCVGDCARRLTLERL